MSPGLAALAGAVPWAHLPPVSPAELLDRPAPVGYGPAAHAMVAGRRVLVTGAGGSIGSEIVRQLQGLEPAEVFLLDHDESALHSLELELEGHGLLEDDRTILADIRDGTNLTRVFAAVRPDIVYHAAAHKHLPLLERYPVEGVKTNVLGTRNVMAAAVLAGVERIVNVSTDKAAAPTSVLGATKRVAEMVTASYAGGASRVASVRFGNVLGSRGSFLPTLIWQVANGHPVTITDPDVSRFFMTIPEAAGLVIEASAMADAGETYVLDMGQPVRILDLVERYLRLTGAPIPAQVCTGLRAGEKLHEELLDEREIGQTTAHPRIWVVHARDAAGAGLAARVARLARLAADGSPAEVEAALWSLVPRTNGQGAGRPVAGQPRLAAAQ